MPKERNFKRVAWSSIPQILKRWQVRKKPSKLETAFGVVILAGSVQCMSVRRPGSSPEGHAEVPKASGHVCSPAVVTGTSKEPQLVTAP